ncbi:uncharacterized protein LOC135950590 [Calliphora vicina]|uniref:uncharacterized protein LOC135950590 n=1 Tax=Calliphora vicina TaxID=7373 RepID=UPI00325B5632
MSDNGTNFVGASKALLDEYAAFLRQSSKEISEKYALHGFEWKFIPPSAPHMGGLWEAGVKSFKLHFRKVVGNQKFNFEEFSTLLVRIEGVLNSRPLSPMTEDPEDLNVLTAGHFLRGAPIMVPPEMAEDDLNISLLNRWEKLKALHHRFAQRWKADYLQELHKRYKWRYPKKELLVGDFVIVKDELLPPNDWRLGRIETVYHGSDKRIRVADIRTQCGLAAAKAIVSDTFCTSRSVQDRLQINRRIVDRAAPPPPPVRRLQQQARRINNRDESSSASGEIVTARQLRSSRRPTSIQRQLEQQSAGQATTHQLLREMVATINRLSDAILVAPVQGGRHFEARDDVEEDDDFLDIEMEPLL